MLVAVRLLSKGDLLKHSPLLAQLVGTSPKLSVRPRASYLIDHVDKSSRSDAHGIDVREFLAVVSHLFLGFIQGLDATV